MRFLQSKFFVLIVFLFVVISGCNENSISDYYEKDINEWEAYLSAITGQEKKELKNVVLLVLKSSECSPALAELSWWNSFIKDQKDIEVKLIIIERYATTAKVLLEQENIFIPSYRDSAGIIMKKELLPSTPMKIYFDQKGKIANIKSIGASTDELEFIN